MTNQHYHKNANVIPKLLRRAALELESPIKTLQSSLIRSPLWLQTCAIFFLTIYFQKVLCSQLSFSLVYLFRVELTILEIDWASYALCFTFWYGKSQSASVVMLYHCQCHVVIFFVIMALALLFINILHTTSIYS